MLWLVSLLEIQILLALWVLLMLYAAWATIYSKMPYGWKILAIPFIFIVVYTTMVTTEHVVGTPSYTDEEIQGKLNGYSVFEFGGKKYLAILLTTKEGPRTYAVIYNSEDEKNLSQAMQKFVKTGVPTIVRRADGKLSQNEGEGEGNNRNGKPSKSGKNGKSGRDDGTEGSSLEFYDFTDQYLVPKEEKTQ